MLICRNSEGVHVQRKIGNPRTNEKKMSPRRPTATVHFSLDLKIVQNKLVLRFRWGASVCFLCLCRIRSFHISSRRRLM